MSSATKYSHGITQTMIWNVIENIQDHRISQKIGEKKYSILHYTFPVTRLCIVKETKSNKTQDTLTFEVLREEVDIYINGTKIDSVPDDMADDVDIILKKLGLHCNVVKFDLNDDFLTADLVNETMKKAGEGSFFVRVNDKRYFIHMLPFGDIMHLCIHGGCDDTFTTPNELSVNGNKVVKKFKGKKVDSFPADCACLIKAIFDLIMTL